MRSPQSAAERQAALASTQSTTSTTVTRRDASGNVVDVQKSQSSVDAPRRNQHQLNRK